MSQRYYVEAVSGERAVLSGPEAHHLTHVMRAKVGSEITLFDGEGGEYLARVHTLRRNEVELEVGERQEVDRELPRPLIAGVAMPKGDRQKWLVEKLTELGVTELVPLVTARGVVDLRDKSLGKLDRVVIEASKQCERNRLMTIASPQPLEEFLRAASGERYFAHPAGEPLAVPASGERGDAIYYAIGPEGGFTDQEVERADAAGWLRRSLGRSILRIETAAVAMAAVLGR